MMKTKSFGKPIGKAVTALCLTAVLTAIPGAALTSRAEPVFTPAMARADAAAATAVWKIEQSLPDLQDSYLITANRVKDMDTEKYEFRNPYTGQKIVVEFGNRRQVEMQVTKFVVPEQLKLTWENMQVTATLTKRQLEAVAMDLFTAMFQAQQQIALEAIAVGEAQAELARAEASLRAGRISPDARALTAWKVDNALLKQEEAKENLASLQRQYLSTFGRDPSEELGTIQPAVEGIFPGEDVEGYVQSALRTRQELTLLRRQIAIEEMKMEIYHFKDLYLRDSATILDYEHASITAEQKRAELAQLEFEIEGEIRAALMDIEQARLAVASNENALARQQNRLAQLKAFLNAGRITGVTVAQMETANIQIITGLEVARQDLSNKCRRFSYATSYGPAY